MDTTEGIPIVVSQTGRVHVIVRHGVGRWFHTRCGQILIGWVPEPEQTLAVSCRRCREWHGKPRQP